ncbi:hypothetical protein GGR54DRAFT_367815 [Hypoxylon sp. NC1633]|nr:hypothetical protein GGR54DRAFT_367815 [Hypoxylon sp. NC1633]
MALDIVILAIPQARVWKLILSVKRRILVSLVFLLGAFVIIASCVRIVYLLTVNVDDLTYTFAVPGIWTNVELNMSIICANLPVIYSLFKPSTQKQSPSSKLISSQRRQYEDLELSQTTGGSKIHDVRITSDTESDRTDAFHDRVPTPQLASTTRV